MSPASSSQPDRLSTSCAVSRRAPGPAPADVADRDHLDGLSRPAAAAGSVGPEGATRSPPPRPPSTTGRGRQGQQRQPREGARPAPLNCWSSLSRRATFPPQLSRMAPFLKPPHRIAARAVAARAADRRRARRGTRAARAGPVPPGLPPRGARPACACPWPTAPASARWCAGTRPRSGSIAASR